MNILILGAAGFIGTNLTFNLSKNKDDKITLVDKNKEYFVNIEKKCLKNVTIKEASLDEKMDFSILDGQDIVYHLVSSNVPTTSNQHISLDIQANVLFSSYLFDACVEHSVKKVVFISSGGTVYGKEATCPLSEETPTNPISSYGIQKITIEKLLYLYNYMYGLDYRIIRLANPY
ncbi:NAD-dependent epimerase/dehydratase family protein, partial [Coprococcus eutactus]|uniref:NAD-dependent epimerase/dehydratase family protein n=1 Tax=Coprococcus eutactus TaxID=33043 RepID=UPI001C01C5FF